MNLTVVTAGATTRPHYNNLICAGMGLSQPLARLKQTFRICCQHRISIRKQIQWVAARLRDMQYYPIPQCRLVVSAFSLSAFLWMLLQYALFCSAPQAAILLSVQTACKRLSARVKIYDCVQAW